MAWYCTVCKTCRKIYPIELQEQVVAYFAAQKDIKVFLFGGGKKEQEIFDSWTAKYPTVSSMIGKLDMQKELNLISYLDVMLSMDSANMHLASLVNTRVVSVWGATHLCWLYGLASKRVRCCSNRYVLSSLLGLWQKTLPPERLCLSLRHFAETNYRESRRSA